MTVTVSPETKWGTCISLTKSRDDGYLGYTNLRVTGTPEDIWYIELEISRMRVQKIYPSSLREFAPFRVFDLAVPIPPDVTVDFIPRVTKETTLTFEWDVVTFLDFDPEPRHNMLYKTIVYAETPDKIKAGKTRIWVPYNQLTEDLAILTDHPVTSVEINIDDKYRLHVPYKGMHNGRHMYQYVFESPFNFMQPDRVYLDIESDTDTLGHTFATNQNILVVWKGMVGIYFSK